MLYLQGKLSLKNLYVTQKKNYKPQNMIYGNVKLQLNLVLTVLTVFFL